MNTLTYKTIIEKDGKAYHGYAPALPGCHSSGKTIDETRKNLKKAMEGWILSRTELGWTIPKNDIIESLQTVEIPSSFQSQAYA